MQAETIENYLRAIYEVQPSDGAVSNQILSKRLGLKQPSVTSAVKKLADLGLIVYEPYQGARLTRKGRNIALRVLRSHRLVELFLVKMLDVPWDQVHAEADKWEHVISETMADRIDDLLGYPARDPHGAPIPTREGTITNLKCRSLVALAAGQAAIVAQLSDRNPEMLRYLGKLGIKPGVKLTLVEVAPFEGPLTVRIGEDEHILGHKLARQIRVMPDEVAINYVSTQAQSENDMEDTH